MRRLVCRPKTRVFCLCGRLLSRVCARARSLASLRVQQVFTRAVERDKRFSFVVAAAAIIQFAAACRRLVAKATIDKPLALKSFAAAAAKMSLDRSSPLPPLPLPRSSPPLPLVRVTRLVSATYLFAAATLTGHSIVVRASGDKLTKRQRGKKSATALDIFFLRLALQSARATNCERPIGGNDDHRLFYAAVACVCSLINA